MTRHAIDEAPGQRSAYGVSAAESANFVREVHAIVRDLLHPNPAIFWTDFLLTISAGYAALALYLSLPDYSIAQAAAFAVCGLAIYRAVVFTHEIAHRPPGTFRVFHCVWNLLCGIPALMPSFLYGDHKSHHLNQSYGTAGDAEYVFLGRRRTAWIFLLLSIVYPVLGPLRFSLMTPLALLVRPADRLIWRYASSLFILNPDYRREYDASAHSASRWVQEIACCVWAWCLTWLIWTRVIPMHAAIKIYFLFLFWIALNQLRALTAHRYGNAGYPWNYVGQVLDTNTFATGALLPELWAPVGMRYHALHHLMPSLPYHAAREAHRRLVERLPSGSPYHQTVQEGLWPPVKAALFGRRTKD